MGAAAVPLAIGSTAAGTGLSIFAANEQNAALDDAAKQAQRAAELQSAGVRTQTQQRLDENRREADRVRGRIRVALGDRGVTGGTAQAIKRQTDIDAARNEAVIRRNSASDIATIRSAFDAQNENFRNQRQSLPIAGLSGLLTGLNTGLSIIQFGQSEARLDDAEKLRPIE